MDDDRLAIVGLKEEFVGLLDVSSEETSLLVLVGLVLGALVTLRVVATVLNAGDVGDGDVVVEGLLFVVVPSSVSSLVLLQSVSNGSACGLNVLLSLCELLGGLVSELLEVLVLLLLGDIDTVASKCSNLRVQILVLVVALNELVGGVGHISELLLGVVLSLGVLSLGCIRLVELRTLDGVDVGVLSESRDCNTGNTGGYCDSTCESSGANTVLEHVIPL